MSAPFFLLLLVRFAAGSTPAATRGPVPAIYVFGDSTVDVGNNNYLPAGSFKANFRPYGIDYPGSSPTGRFCNGYLGVDFISKRLGFKESPPAALSVKTAAEESRGVNYASAGSGVLDHTGENMSISLNSQIKFFRKTIGRLMKARGGREAHLFLSKSIFIFNIGTNDLFAPFSNNPLAQINSTFLNQYISSVTALFQKQLQRLYGLGARRMMVFGTGQIGCAPIVRRLSITADCLKVLNDLSRKHNIAMKEKLRGLSLKHKGLKYSYINFYDITGVILDRAAEFGFKEVKSACCGSGYLNADTFCLPNSTYCSDRASYLLWDAGHPTQATYKRIVDLAYSGVEGFVEPISLDDLMPYR